MPVIDRTNVNIALQLEEAGRPRLAVSREHSFFEAIEAMILAFVAITTAWSGYQAARWDSIQSELYGRSSRLRVEAEALDVEANQQKMYALTLSEWLKSQARHETRLAALFERRLLPEFLPYFEAWKQTDPIHNPLSPPGPQLMPGYHNQRADEAAGKNRSSTQLFEEGTRARERADAYVRLTVYLATVLLLTAMSQRFASHWVRATLLAISFLMFCYPIWCLISLPRA